MNDRIIQCNNCSMYEAVLTMQHFVSRTFNTMETPTCNKSADNKRRIFVCTTMHQESSLEMDKLLASIRNISYSNLLKREHIVLESHIFLDNGADGQTIKQFGLQLMRLIENQCITNINQGVMLFTPYGLQLSWEVNKTTPLFVHLKDVSKVKAKKRWSQIMYMEYILHYRTSNFWRYSDNFPIRPPYAGLHSIDTWNSPEELYETAQHDFTLLDKYCKSLVKQNEIYCVDTESTEIYVADTSKNEKCPDRNESFNIIHTIKDSQQLHHEQDKFGYDNYILATDADMTFTDRSILKVLHMCESDRTVGAVCGRTYPTGIQYPPIVWLQMFEYAKGKICAET
ncbi:chitin synthase chs-1-like [Mytilus edulis]|uniref:chitin synthase chs-1-like n=1 Tax=Mytilus edulis TaxID=6550 RepID=UPI0039EF0AE8